MYAYLLSCFVLVAVTLAHEAPAPQPAAEAKLKNRQTSRQEIIERAQNQLSPQKRASGLAYPTCDETSPNIMAAVYTDTSVSTVNMDTTTAASVYECIEQCLDRLNIGCRSADWDETSGQCWMTSSIRPGFYANDGFQAFVLYYDCAAFQRYTYAGATCCDY